MIKEFAQQQQYLNQFSSAYLGKAFQEVDIKNSEIGNSMNDFKIITELGRGSYGTVYKVISLKDNLSYVLKKISLQHMKQKQQQAALKEVQILRTLHHAHVIKYYTSFMQDESIHIVMEFAEKGDLYRLLKEQRQKRKYFSEKDLWDFSYQICLGLEYLHQKNIIHRDIKCLNIFLTEDKRIKLGDLGVSKIVSSAAALQDTRVGTPLYLSPELVKQQPYDFKVDLWAVGCALYHMAQLEPPFQGDNLITLGNNIVNKKPKPLPQIYSNKLINFIERFLVKKPQDRPTAQEAVQLIPSFVKNAYNEAMNSKKLLDFDDSATQQANQPTLKAQSPLKDQALIKSPSNNAIGNNNNAQVRDRIIKRQSNNNNIKASEPSDKGQTQGLIITQQISEMPKITQSDNKNVVTDLQPKKQSSQTLIQIKEVENTNKDVILPAASKQTPKNAFIVLSPQKTPQNELLRQKPPVFEKTDSTKDFRTIQKARYQSTVNQQSQVALQSTNEDTKTIAQNKQQIVQFKIESALQKIQEDEKLSSFDKNSQYQRGLQLSNPQQASESMDNKRQSTKSNQQNIFVNQFDKQIRKEMPYHARPQTASASQVRKQQQSSASIKPGISLLRNLVNRNNFDEDPNEKNYQDDVQNFIIQQHNNRPFSAAPPLNMMGFTRVKKNVMFEDELKDNSELEIPEDDDEANDNAYQQFNCNPVKVKIIQAQKLQQQPSIQEQKTAAPLEQYLVKQSVQINRQNMRPMTANISQYRSSSHISTLDNRRSYDYIESEELNQNKKPTTSQTQFRSRQTKKIVAQSQESINQKPWQNQNPNKNELNRQTQQEFENQFSRFYKVNLKKTSATVMPSQSSEVINNNDLKNKIKNYQPVSIHSQLSSVDLDQRDNTNYGSYEKNGRVSLNQHMGFGYVQAGVQHKNSSTALDQNNIQKRQSMIQIKQKTLQNKKITIRDLEPINKNISQKQQDK